MNEAAEEFRHLLADSVRLRLQSDVPVGTCLSGGLDSSSIVSLASRQIEEPVRTFSSVYPQKDCSEGHFIDEVVSGFKTVASRVEPQAHQLPEVFEKLTWHQDEPTAGPGLFSQWNVMRLAQGQVTVLLDGQGGDELMAGYHHYFQDYLTTLAQEMVRQRQPDERLLALVPSIDQVTGRPHAEAAARALRRARRPAILKMFRRERPGRVKTSPLFSSAFAERIGTQDQKRTAPNTPFKEVLNSNSTTI